MKNIKEDNWLKNVMVLFSVLNSIILCLVLHDTRKKLCGVYQQTELEMCIKIEFDWLDRLYVVHSYLGYIGIHRI